MAPDEEQKELLRKLGTQVPATAGTQTGLSQRSLRALDAVASSLGIRRRRRAGYPAGPQMRSRRSGAIVQVSGMGGQLSLAGFAAYSATKFALEGMSEALADEVRPLGITVLIVEPGAFRTGLFGNHSASTPIPDYSGTVGRTRQMVEASAGSQPGDPAKAATAILTALDAPDTPLRLPLGDDAVDAILSHIDSTRADIRAWEKLARDTRLAG
jgi:NAD(P)-dependent dehydrogenase (short-subunit alcohol dehydrogenase family)